MKASLKTVIISYRPSVPVSDEVKVYCVNFLISHINANKNMGFCFFGLEGVGVFLLFVRLFTRIHTTSIILKLVSSP